MEEYDVVVVGGGIAGSVASRFAAKSGFKTLLIEKYKTPRNKACSGVQWTYFERLIGEKIPREKLCENELSKVELITPTDRVLKGGMKLLNFWRSTFDSWLNTLAVKAGAEFQDETSLTDFHKDEKGFIIKISAKNQRREVKTQYLVGADGLSSSVRRKLRPEDFDKKSSGATLNYYFVGDTDLDPNTLYLFYKKEFSPLMFSWVYKKDEKWVIGTGADKNLLEYAERFFDYVKKKHSLHGEIVKKEGFSSTFRDGVFLGEGNLLMVGDAAGLIDFYRGMGMDNAALSGRLAAKAIMKAKEKNCPAIKPYQCLMKRAVSRLETNAKRQAKRYSSNEMFEKSFSSLSLMKFGLLAIIGNQINKVLPAEKLILLPI
ncbi:MAG: NAD(P)/FAD-dependent oxidoreductase [Candidatus Bathyarchaeia archaeon]